MQIFSFLILLLVLPFAADAIPVTYAPKKAITFGWGGRLGDNLLDYSHAKWISYKWKIPLYFKPFEYSDQFIFHDYEEHLTAETSAKFTEKVLISVEEIREKIKSDTLFFLPHVCDSYDEHLFLNARGPFVEVDWTDEKFRKMMKALIVPKNPLTLFYPPKDRVSVAVHCRTGGGFGWDTDSMKKQLPLRFPEFEYYLEQLDTLYHYLRKEPLFVYIFTDSQEPEILMEQFKAYFSDANILFECRQEGNRHDANVLEDLFSMMNFDCLIRPMSHYSMTASHLVDYKIEFYPIHGHWKERRFTVDRVQMIEKSYFDKANHRWMEKNKIPLFKLN